MILFLIINLCLFYHLYLKYSEGIYSQLYAYFKCNKLLYSSQYGFRQGHSTEFLALELIDKITFLMQEGKVPVGVFLDMSKAFDTLNHDILLDELSYLGISAQSWQYRDKRNFKGS